MNNAFATLKNDVNRKVYYKNLLGLYKDGALIILREREEEEEDKEDYQEDIT